MYNVLMAMHGLDASRRQFPINVQELLGDFPLKKFVDEHLHRIPLALPGVGQGVQHLGTWTCLAPMLASPGADLMVVRQGQRYECASPRDLASAQALCAEGCTLLIRHAEQHHADVCALAKAFEHTFCGPVNVHVYATPPASFGFSWHYDAEDVFIVQTTGEKEYFLRKNTVNPWPLEETLPADMQYEREIMPLMRVVLRAGDLLYIPCGYWHRAQTTNCAEVAISLAIGVMSRAAIDIFNMLRSELVNSLVWRQRLPVTCDGGTQQGDALKDAYRHILQQLAHDVSSTLTSPPFLDAVVSQQFSQFTESPADCAAPPASRA
jgi:50S ribosomal protein L16 3-hydroxylase